MSFIAGVICVFSNYNTVGFGVALIVFGVTLSVSRIK